MIKKICDKCSSDEFDGLYCKNCGETFSTQVYAVVEGTDPYFIHAVFDDMQTAKGHAEALNAIWYPGPPSKYHTLGDRGHVKVLAFVLNRYQAISPVKAETV